MKGKKAGQQWTCKRGSALIYIYITKSSDLLSFAVPPDGTLAINLARTIHSEMIDVSE